MDQKLWILACGHEHILQHNIDPKDFKCPTPVRVILPCGHESTQKPCHRDVNEWTCGLPCDVRVEPCGHSCIQSCHFNDDPDHTQYKCHKPCGRAPSSCSTGTHKCSKLCHEKCSPCQITMKKKLSNCNHKLDVGCSASIDGIACNQPCEKKITSCGHDCKLKCYEPCGDCVQTVMKTIPLCGHGVETKCTELVDIKNCHGSCPKLLPCGHLCKEKCNEVCTKQCRELVEHTKPAFCGHKFKIECHLQTQELSNYSNILLQFCEEPCTAILVCKHKCSGTCGECAQGRIHAPCMKKCGIPLICGHECTFPCHEVCQPCRLKCSWKCCHSKCSKTCGEVCTKCDENCARQCKHVQCTSKCGDMCSVPPCQEPCENMLPCSHPCVGFCGDPCPPLCRICNKEELTFLGYENAIDARFVLLDECKHVIENHGMEIFLKQYRTSEINYRSCPKCRTQLTSTQRYSDYIKQDLVNGAIAKEKISGSPREIQAKRQELQEKLVAVKLLRQGRVLSTSQGFEKFINECEALLLTDNKNKRLRFDLMLGKTLESKLTIVRNIGYIFLTQKLNISNCTTREPSPANDVFSEATAYVEYLFKRLTRHIERITNQEIEDFKREQERLHRIAQLVNIAEISPLYGHKEIRGMIYLPIIYTENYDNMIKDRLNVLQKIHVAGYLTDHVQLEIGGELCSQQEHQSKHSNIKIRDAGDCGDANQIMKTIPAFQHEVNTKYNEPANIADCNDACATVLPCEHPSKKKYNEVGIEQCCELVEHTKPVFCGHSFKIECHLVTQELPKYSNTFLQFCKEPCNAMLDCEHKCSGTCGECAQGRIHTTCMKKCGVTLFCGHECKTPCSEVCQPCPLKCGLKCIHSKCTKRCGDVCTRCDERCARRCKHVECTSRCWEICSVPPCKEPCEKMLRCSHPCVGFCGDRCSPFCRICHEEELTEIFLGFEDEVDARFVYLEECGQVIESQGMDIYCKQNESGRKGISYRRCPRCRIPLTSTQRYSDYVKQDIKDIAAVKKKGYVSQREIEAKRKELRNKLHTIKLFKQGRVLSTSKGFDKFINDCDALLQPVNKNRRQKFDLMIGQILEAKVTIVQNIGNILEAQELNVGRSTTRVDNDVFLEATSYVEYLFKRLTTQVELITNQEINDFKRERERLHRIAQFVKIVESSSESSDHKEIRELIYQPIIYTENYDKVVKVKLEEFLKKMRIGAPLTDVERLEIVRVMGLKKGHWNKCPNGHIYAIGDCGGANQISRCNECGVQIGGTNHALLPGNNHAGEMDGSQHAACTDSANMLNYRLDNLE